jgi:hypothetical protein
VWKNAKPKMGAASLPSPTWEHYGSNRKSGQRKRMKRIKEKDDKKGMAQQKDKEREGGGDGEGVGEKWRGTGEGPKTRVGWRY